MGWTGVDTSTPLFSEGVSRIESLWSIFVQYELYELYDWEKVPELYGTLQWTWNFMELLQF